MPQTVYLDDNGEPLNATRPPVVPKVYLDDNGEPVSQTPMPAAATRGMLAQSTSGGDPTTVRQREQELMGQAMRVPVDLVIGAAKRLGETAKQGGSILRKIPGVNSLDRVMTPIQVDTTPSNTAQRIGGMVEQGVEFAAPLLRVSRAVQGLPFLARAGAEAAASAGVAGVQSGGDPGSMVVGGVAGAALPVLGAGLRVARRGAAGAAEGGVGGAIAATIRGVAPSEPRVMLVQALKPRSTRTNFPKSLERAIPEIKAAEQALGKPIGGIDDLLTATKAAKSDIQAQLNQLRGPQHAMGAEVDLSSVAEAMTRSIPKKVQLETPEIAQRLTAAADVYRRPFSLEDTETLLRETNAELEGFYAQYPQAQRKALLSNPHAAALEAQATELRTAIYRKLDAPGQGDAARELNRRYGALMEVENEAFRRSNVAARQQPESLSEQIGMVRAAGQAARGAWRAAHGDLMGVADIAGAAAGRSAAKAIKESQTTDALIRRAFASYKGQRVPVALSAQPRIAGLLPRGATRMRGAPDPSFARGVPAMPAQSQRRALPPGRPPIVGSAAETSGGGGVPAKSSVQRDPRTGRMRRVYLGENR